MDLIKADLENMNIHDINNSQAVMLFHLGDTALSVGELTSRGIYLGSNVSYNVKKMVENGYLTQEHSADDRRVSYVRVTEKGRKLREELTLVHQLRLEQLAPEALSAGEIEATTAVLHLLDRFWNDVLDHGWQSR
jgi:DNA-binding MarR family transcriptional regulator